MTALTHYWPRAIIHVDMNAFFASVEQRDFPELRGKPVGVTNGAVGTTLITCSYEARAAGVKTGMRIYEARKLCPGLIQRPARPKVYVGIATRIMHVLQEISPDVQVFSVDEAFLDVTHCQRLYGDPERIAHMVRQRVHDISGGLPCSIGVAGTKSTAKVASDLKKPNGLTVIPPWKAREYLNDIPMRKICGLGPNIAEFLSLHGAHTCGDVARLPMTVLARRFGVTGNLFGSLAKERMSSQLSLVSRRHNPSATARCYRHIRPRRALLKFICGTCARRLRRACAVMACKRGSYMWV